MVEVLETQFLINPHSYRIRQGDKGYVITDDFEDIVKALEIDSNQSLGYNQYLEN